MKLTELLLDIYVIVFWTIMLTVTIPALLVLSPLIIARYLYVYLSPPRPGKV